MKLMKLNSVVWLFKSKIADLVMQATKFPSDILPVLSQTK